MKTFVKTLALAALVAANSFNTSANNNDKQPAKAKGFVTSTYRVNDQMVVKLAIEKTKGSQATVTLKDAAGHTLFTEAMDNAEAMQRWQFNMRELKDGAYSLVISDGNNVETKTIWVISTIEDELLVRRVEVK
jgi:hypothetical protein